MWGVWSDLMEVWMQTHGGVFVTERQSIAEAQVLCLQHQLQMNIAQAEAKAAEMRQKQSPIIRPNAMQVQGIGRVPIGRAGNGSPKVPQGDIQVMIPPDPRWRARRFDEWWKSRPIEPAEPVELRG